MFAVVKTGGKQYKVKEGDILNVEKLGGEVGETIALEEVLLIANDQELKIGQPLVPDAKVLSNIINHGKSKKIIVFKSKRRKGYQKKHGHRQEFTRLKIDKIIG